MEELNIVYKPIKELKPYKKNAKKHSKEQVEQIANSIKEFGFTQPVIIVDKLWISSNEYVIEKEPVTGKYYLYVNGQKYSEAKTLKTVKEHANEHFRKSPKKIFA